MGKKLKSIREFARQRAYEAARRQYPGATYNEYWEGEQTAYTDMIRRIDELEGKA